MVQIIITLTNPENSDEFIEQLRLNSIDYKVLDTKGGKPRFLLQFSHYNFYSNFINDSFNKIDSCIFVEKGIR